MTEPKRWTVPCGPDAEIIFTGGYEPVEVVAAADFDRLRDERDEMIRVSAANIVTTQRNMDEARRVAGVLAGALRDSLEHTDGECSCEQCEQARSALAVFDTLTEEKT